MSPLFQHGDKRAQRSRSAAFSRVRRVVRRVAELFPWTPLGVLLTIAAYASLEWFAYAELDRIWLVVGYVGLGFTLFNPFLVLAVAAWLRLRGPLAAPPEPLVVETGKPTRTGFRMRSVRFIPLVELGWSWRFPPRAEVELRSAQEGGVLELVRVDERGRFERIERRVRVADTLGLSRVVMTLAQARRCDVLPSLGNLRHLPSLTGFASGDALPHPMGLEDGDRLELQRYTPGDPARFIHWKVLGRTRRLMVRMPERALTVARRTAAFFVAGSEDDASAAVARLSIEQHLLGGEWVFGTDDDPVGTTRPEAALDLLMRSCASRERAGENLQAFVESVEREGPASLVVFVPPVPGPWLDRIDSVLRRKKPRVVVGTDGAVDLRPRPFVRRLLTLAPAPPAGTSAEALERVAESLDRAGASVLVFDRSSGQALGAAHRQAMARLQAAAAGGR